MASIIEKKIGKELIVWFENSNQWIQLDQKQQFVYHLFRSGSPQKETIFKYQNRFSVAPSDAQHHVSSLYEGFITLDKSTFAFPDFTVDADRALKLQIPKAKTHHYQYLNRCFTIVYGFSFMIPYLHLPLKHLETDTCEGDLKLEVYRLDNRYAIRINDQECKTADEVTHIKRLIYNCLSDYLFADSASSAFWMTILHASAVTKNNQLLVFSSFSGAGKSTMAALLQKNDFRFFSDDFIPVSLENELAYPFPAALSLKRRSATLFKNAGVKIPTETIEGAAFLSPPDDIEKTLPLPIKQIIFIHWEKDVPLSFQKIPLVEALQLYLKESWVTNTPQGAQQFINWFTRLKFYRLHYSNNASGVAAVERMMGGGGK